jgi:hypothetical protein
MIPRTALWNTHKLEDDSLKKKSYVAVDCEEHNLPNSILAPQKYKGRNEDIRATQMEGAVWVARIHCLFSALDILRVTTECLLITLK